MEGKKTPLLSQMRIRKVYLFRVCYNKGVRLHCLCLAAIQSWAEEWESFIMEKKQEGIPDALIGMGSCKWATEKLGILCDWLDAHIWLSPLGTKLEVGAKIREAISY